MPKRKVTEEEIENGIGDIGEVDTDEFEVEEADDEQPSIFAADEDITGDEE